MGRRQRDAQRSKRRILDAAETAFAGHGYEAASLAEIGRTAGVSAALPAYFFGDKAGLHHAVIQRLFHDRDEALAPVVANATAALDQDLGLTESLTTLVSGYLEFLLSRPTFVQLMARDALDRERLDQSNVTRHSSVFQTGVHDFLSRVPTTVDVAPFDADQMLISIVALCFFPIEHDTTMLASMGYRSRTTAFIERRTAHVVSLVVRALTLTGSDEPGR